MQKKVLSEQVIYYGDVEMPKGWEVNPLNLCKQFFDALYNKKQFSSKILKKENPFSVLKNINFK